jgi:hypothetical protein
MTSSVHPTLRPLGLGELLDQAIRLYRKNFLTFIGIIAIVQVPLSIVQLATSLLAVQDLARLQDPSAMPLGDPSQAFTPGFYTGMFGSVLVGILSFILVAGVATAALTRAIADRYLGQPADILGAYRKIGRAWGRLLGALVLAGLVGLVLFAWMLVPCVGWLTGSGMLAFFFLAVYPLIASVIVLEGRRAKHAWRRAWNLARRRFWWVVGFVAILYLFSQLVVSGPVALVTFALQMLTGTELAQDSPATFLNLQTLIQSLAGLILSLIYLPLQLTCITLLYFDLRVRTEGFDLALLTASASAEAGEIAELPAVASPVQHEKLVTRKELGYFALLSLGAVVVFIVFGGILGLIGMVMWATAGGF